MNACIRATAIAMVSLNLLGASTYPQSPKRESTGQPNHLYRVSTKDEKSGREKFGFIDNTAKLVIGFDRGPRCREDRSPVTIWCGGRLLSPR
jgi:hypothetical protein